MKCFLTNSWPCSDRMRSGLTKGDHTMVEKNVDDLSRQYICFRPEKSQITFSNRNNKHEPVARLSSQ